MLKVKLPYYPQIDSYVKETRFGVLEITTPTVYETPLSGSKIVRVDTLEALREIVGDVCLLARNTTYSIISGSCSVEEYNARLSRYYSKYPQVMAFINNVYEHCDNSVPLGVQTSQRMLEIIDVFSKEMIDKLTCAGGKYLVYTHLYLYFKFSMDAIVPDMKGLKIIC